MNRKLVPGMICPDFHKNVDTRVPMGILRFGKSLEVRTVALFDYSEDTFRLAMAPQPSYHR